MAERNLIMKAVVGAHLYGTNTQKSDKDFVGIFVPDKDYVIGTRRVDQVEIRDNPTDSGRRNLPGETDIVLYSLPKFIHLATQNNPNIIELLYVPEKNLLVDSDWWKRLRAAAPLFLSKKAKHTFCGYAFSQKMKLINRNFEGGRKEVVEQFGFETKFASHIIRLLAEGIQILVEKRLTFPLTNNREVLAVKEGRMDLSQVLARADALEKLVEEAYVRSDLRNSADVNAINDLQIELLESYWKSEQECKTGKPS